MKAKYIKYLVEGAKADARKKFDKELKKVEERSNKRYEWWQEEEERANALENENAALRAELADAKNVIAGYKTEFEKNLGISSEEVQNA